MAERLSFCSKSEQARQIYIAKDAQILKGLYSNEDWAWEKFYNVQIPVVYRQTLRMGLLTQDAEDVAQNVALITYKYIERTRNGNSLDAKPIQVLTPWLRRITAVECFHYWKKQKRHPELDLFDEIAQDPNDKNYQDTVIDKVDFESRFTAAWKTLNENERAIIQSRVLSGGRFSYKDFAQENGTIVGNVGPTFSRAKNKIRRYL